MLILNVRMESGSSHVLVCYLHNSVASGLTLVQYTFTVYINYCVSLQVDLPLYIMAVQL